MPFVARHSGACNQFKHDLNNYLAGLGGKAPLSMLEEIIKSRQFHPSIQARLETAQASNDVPGESTGCRSRDEFRQTLRIAVIKLMTDLKLDALIYPTWSNPPRAIGDLNTPAGDNSQLFAPSTGFPAITVPMGFTRGQYAARRPAVSGTSMGRAAHSFASPMRTSRAHITDAHPRCLDPLIPHPPIFNPTTICQSTNPPIFQYRIQYSPV